MTDKKRDYNEIVDYLYLGGWNAAFYAVPDRFRVILSIIEINTPPIRRAGIEYHQVDMEDLDHRDILTYFPQTCQLIADSVAKKRPILVHCRAGMSRSATVVCAYIMKTQNKSADDAIAFVRQRRNCIQPNVGFVQQLRHFQRMNYTINANDRQFRHFLVSSYFRVENSNQLIFQYFDRLAMAEKMTPNLNRGRNISCSKCQQTVFQELNVIVNSEPMNGCTIIYVEPQTWMIKDLANKICRNDNASAEHEQIAIECPGDDCHQVLVIFKTRLSPYPLSCSCVVHRGLDKYSIFKVIPNSTRKLSNAG